MAQGIERREAVTDSLASAAEVVPVASSAAPLSAPQVQVHSQNYSDAAAQYGVKRSAEIAGSLNKWAGGKLQAMANTQREAAVLDGQMAYQQGVAMEDLEMSGDKWAMQGYRVMNAQTTASTMLTAQREMIKQRDFQSDPDEFRATYINRLKQQIDGMDPETARMVKEAMTEHMPTLVSEQLTAHMANAEQKNFDALATQVSVLSNDPTAFNALVENASGGGAAAALSPDRVNGALVQGVQTAFNEGNPRAYQLIVASGAFNNLPAKQREAIRGAKLRYENMQRSQVSAEFLEVKREIVRDIEAGDYVGDHGRLADDVTALYAANGMEVRGNELGAMYALAGEVGDMHSQEEYNSLLAAISRGDVGAITNATGPIIDQHDAGAVIMNNHNATRNMALSPELMGTLEAVLPDFGVTFEVFSGGQPISDGPNGTHSVGSDRHDGGNAADGFFYKNGRKLDPQNNTADRVVVSDVISALSAAGLTGFGSGEDYMQTGSVHLGYGDTAVWGKDGKGVNAAGWLVTAVRQPGGGGSGVAWADNVARYGGDIEAAALAHKTSQAVADGWLAGNKSWSGIDPAAKKYVEGVMGSVNGGDVYQTMAQRLSISQTALESAKSLRDAILEQETVEGERELSNRMRFAEKQLEEGKINATQFQQVYDRKRDALNLKQSLAKNSYVASQINKSIQAAEERATTAGDTDMAERLFIYKGKQADLDAVYYNAMQEATSVEELQKLSVDWQQASIDTARANGVDLKKTPLNLQHAAAVKEITKQTARVQKVSAAQRKAKARIDIGGAGDFTGKDREDIDAELDRKVAAEMQAGKSVTNPKESLPLVDAQISVWGKAGTVPKDAQQTMSAYINGNMVTDGRPSEGVLDTLHVFKELRASRQDVAAHSMFNDKARLRVEALLAITPGGVFASRDQLSAAMLEFDARSADTRQHDALVDARGVLGEVEIRELSQTSVEEFLAGTTVTEVSAWLSGWEDRNERTWNQTMNAVSEENRNAIVDQIEDRFVQLRALNSGALPATIAALAAEQILAETAVVGDSTIIMNTGYGLKKQMFGDAGLDFGSTPMVEHRAIQGYIAHMAEKYPDKYGNLTGASPGELTPGLSRIIRESVFGQNIGLSYEEAVDVIGGSGVRPFSVHTDDGINAVVSVVDRTGALAELDPAVFGMPIIGQWFMEQEELRLEKETPLD